MITRKPVRILTSSIAALAAIASFSPSTTDAASGSWNVDAAGNWGTAANWTPAAIPGTAAGDVITLGNALTAARTVTIDTTSRSAGDLNIGSTAAFGFTLASSGAAVVLNLDGTGAADATVDFTANANTISAPITLVDNGVFRSNIAAVQTLSGIISGAKSLTFNNDTNGTVNAATSGAGQFTVSGVNTYSLGTSISDVRVTITTSNAALGTGAVTIANGGTVYNSTGLTAIANTFNINGNGWVEAAGQLGALRLEGASIVTGNVVMQSNSAIGSNTGTGAVTGTVNGVVSGAFQLTKVGVGTLALGGANTFSGGLVIANGSVQLNNNNAAGTGAISLVTGGATNATRLFVNGGVTANNNISYGNVFGATGQGVLQQTGTGLATLNGTITITGGPSAGGHFVGGGSAANALVLNGAITSTVALTQRDGFVRYGGGGTGYNSLGVTNTAQVGATNGISTTAAVTLGGSANAALDLNGFDQALASLTLGNAGTNSAFRGSVALGAKTLTLNGDLTTLNTGTGNAIHSVTGSAATINFGSTARNISVADSSAVDDLQISGTTLLNTGGLTKTGAGTLALNGVTLNGAFTVSTGTVRTGLITQAGSLTAGNITFNGGTTLAMKVGTGGDSINAVNFVNAGTTNLVLTQFGGALASGNYNLINYTGTTPGTSGFTLSPIGHATASLVDTGTAIALNISGNDQVIWDGTNNSTWATGATGNWKLGSTLAATDYIEGDDVIFQDGPISSTASIAANVTPSNVTFTNTTSSAISITGAAGIIGATGITKSGNGTVTLSNPNVYGGTTAVQAGTLVLDHSTATPLSTLSQVNVSAGATTRFSHAGGTFALSNPITGAGTVVIDPSTTTAGNRDIATVNWNTTGFTGTLRLAPTTGTMRIAVDNPTDLGGGTVEVASGGQIFVSAANLTIPNNITISGTGFSETAGTLGAIRANNPTTFTGVITVNGSAKLGALGGTMNITNTLTGGTLTFGGSVTSASNETLAITGNASGLTSITVNDGLATAGVGSIALNVGDATNTGTIGAVPVSLLADGFKNSIIRFTRTDGYTLGANITSTSLAANHVRTFVDGDAQGTGFSDGGFAINLGGSTSLTGGQFRVGTFRPNAISNITGALTAGQIRVGAGAFALATMNINSGAVVNAGNVHVGLNAAATNSVLNINAGATVNASYLTLSELASSNGILNQNGGTLSVDSQVRVGHFGTETSTYNMAGGSLTLTGASPTLTPSTAGAGAANTTGDNNINALAVATLVGGGIYVGIDGQGTFNHTGGTVTTNWLVLDNRGASGAGTNMADGIDRYNISGSSILNLRSTWGMRSGNITGNEGSYAVSFGGGTILVDNTGTGTGTGANINIPLDVTVGTVAATTTNLDTNGAGNGFTLSRDIRGTGTLALAGGGAVNLTTAGSQVISAGLSGANPLTKLGAGTTTLTGVNTGFTGPVTVSAGRLNLNTATGTLASLTLADGTTFSGEPTVGALTLGATTGSTLIFNPNTGGALTATTLNAPSNTVLDFSSIPGDGTYQALSFGSKLGAGTFSLAGAANYRSASVVEGATTVDVTISGTKALVWLAAGGTTWDVNTTTNWGDSANANAPDKFFSADVVTFDDTAVGGTAVTVTAGVAPALVQVSGTTNNYTLTSTGAGIAGGEIVKDGSTTLTLVGPNTYPGKTTIQAGTVSIAAATSLGNALPGNSIVLSNGGRLAYSGTTAFDLGANRNIAVGSGGGVIAHTGTTVVGYNVSGNLSGSGALKFSTTGTGTVSTVTTYTLNGNNSAYTGPITVEATGNLLSALTIPSQANVPNASSITLNYPAASVTSGNATTLNLNHGVTLPVGTTLNFTSSQATTAISLRSGTQTAANGTVVINGPITLAGTSIVQFGGGAASTTTFNGPITETTPGSFVEAINPFSNVVFFRGSTTNTHIINNTITLPSLGSTIAVTDGATLIVNSTGSNYRSANAVFGTVRLGANDALPTSARLVIGQAGDQAATLDLNGFNQTMAGLEWQAPTGNLLTKGISNSHPTATSTFTLNQATAPLANYNGTISGRTNFVKEGAATTALVAPASTFTGNVTVNAGTLSATGAGAVTGANGTLGAANVVGKTVTVNNAGSTLSFLTNNIFGNGVGNANLPAVTLNGGTLTSTRYNVLGALTLNGGTLTQSSTDGPGAYEGFQFRGNVTVGGSAQSVISTGNGKADHLGANTVFTVADAATGVDLLVSAPLKDQSADFGGTGGLTKSGPGTMELSGSNTYTGTTLVTDGVLRVSGSISGSAVTVDGATAVLGGTGTVGATTLLNGGTINPGASPGILNVAGNFTMGLGTNFGAEIDGTTVGTQYDQLNVTGLVTLGGSTLTLAGAYTGSADLFTLILNDGASDPVSGTFAGLPEGASILAASSGQVFNISYVGGDGNDVVLTAVPEPGSAVMLLGGVGMLLGMQRRRRRA